MLAATTPAWYLAVCVWVPSPVTSPAAHTAGRSCSGWPTRQVASTGIAVPGLSSMPSLSRPSPLSRGRRPVASSTRSASIRVPSSSVSASPSSVRSALAAADPRRTSTPVRRSASARISPVKGASAGSRELSVSTSVTCEPNAA